MAKKIVIVLTEKQAKILYAAASTRYSNGDSYFLTILEKIHAAIRQQKRGGRG